MSLTADHYAPTRKNVSANLLQGFKQNKYHNYNQKEEEIKSLKITMIFHQRKKIDKVKGK